MVAKPTDKRTVRPTRPARSAGAAPRAVPGQDGLRAGGDVALGVAHDLANMLGAMQIRIELLQQQPELLAAGDELAALARATREAAALVAGMQKLYAGAAARPAAVDLGRCLADAVAVASSGLRLEARLRGSQLRIEQRLPPLPRVRGRAPQLHRMFVDLLVNARDAVPAGGRIVIDGGVQAGQVLVRVRAGRACFELRFARAGAGAVKAARSASRAAGSPR
jgi:signal transduction histidine kinase